MSELLSGSLLRHCEQRTLRAVLECAALGRAVAAGSLAVAVIIGVYARSVVGTIEGPGGERQLVLLYTWH